MAEPTLIIEQADVEKQSIRDNKKLTKRLFPLYLAAFLHGFVLWYVIEKLFMRSIGFDDAGIGFMVAAYSVMMLLVETPSGILADRWSRKGVLILASIALAVCGAICGLSTEPTLYIIGALFWGIFFALFSGTYESIIYDTVLEETGSSTMYEHYFGREKFIASAALVVSSIFGGVLGQVSGLPVVYFWSVLPALLAIFALWRFKEPQLHRAEPLGSIKEHVVETFSSVLKNGVLLRLLTLLVIITILITMLYEFSQLWYIALAIPPVLFGPAFAAVQSAIGIGGVLAGKFSKYRLFAKVGGFACLLISSLSLIFFSQLIVIVVAQVLFGVSSIVLSILFMRELHDLLPSRVRAGASSAVSTIGRVTLIPIALLFGFVSSHVNVFSAAWIIVGLVIVSIVVASLPRAMK